MIVDNLANSSEKVVDRIETITAEKERIGTELELARKIQADTLPSVFPAFPDRKEFDLYAAMHPAKEVGGDFYDFLLIDEDHLALVVADVSGKGVPAALFMMVSKLLVQNYIAMGWSPSEVLKTVNDRLCSNNQEEMFVTVWLGVLDIRTGLLTAANAGHEYPILKEPDKPFEVYHDKHGFVIGGMAGVSYKDYELKLKPGSKLFLYSDGVPEAMNPEGVLFGLERTLDALNREPDGTPKQILENVQQAITDFSGEAPQFDDITMMCVVYAGVAMQQDGEVQEMTTDALVENIEPVTEFVVRKLEQMRCPSKARMQIEVMVDEVFGNIVRYAYPDKVGSVTIRMEEVIDPRGILIEFEDAGTPYNPLEREDPDVTLPSEERQIGGLGIYLVKKLMDEVRYEYRSGKNVLSIRKNM